MKRLRFQDPVMLWQTGKLRSWHYRGHAQLLSVLKNKEVEADQTLRDWIDSLEWRRNGLLLWLVDRTEKKVVATAFVSVVPTLVPKILVNDVVVDPDHQGTGLGRRLMEELIRQARHKWPKADRIDLTSEPRRAAAWAMYQSLGFVRRDTGVFRLTLNKAAGG